MRLVGKLCTERIVWNYYASHFPEEIGHNADIANFLKTTESEVEFTLEAGAHTSQDIVIDTMSGYKYLFSYPRVVDPVGQTAHIEITVYRRTDNVFSAIIHNSHVGQLSGKLLIINLFALQK